MALPITVLTSGDTWKQPQGGPFKQSGSFSNVVTVGVGTDNRLYPYSASDPSSSWTRSSNSSTAESAGIASIHTPGLIGGDDIPVAYQLTDGNLNYSKYDVSLGGWRTAADSAGRDQIDTAPDSSVNFCSLGIRSDGDLLIAYMGEQDSIMGTGYDRVKLAREEGAGWTAAIAAGAGNKTEVNERYPFGVMSANDRFHVFYCSSTNLKLSTYTGSNSFGVQDSTKASSVWTTKATPRAVRFDDGGTEKIRCLYQQSATAVDVAGFTDADNPTVTDAATDIDDNTTTPVQFALAANGAAQHALFGYSTSVNHDETGDGDDTWGTDATELSSLTSSQVYGANVYDNGGTVLAYLYLDGSNYRYNEKSLSSGAFTITADSGSFTLGAQAVSLEIGYEVAAESASFNLGAQDVALSKGKTITADSAAFAISAQDATLTHDRVAVAESAAFSLGAQDASLEVGHVIAADPAAFALTGQEANLNRDKALAVDNAAFTLGAQDVSLEHGRLLSADSAAFALTGQDVSLTTSGGNTTITADSAAFALTGQDISPEVGRLLSADPAAFTLGAQDVTLSRGRTIAAESAAFALTAQDVSLGWGRVVQAESATFTLGAQDVDLRHAWTITAESAAFTLAGQAVDLAKGLVLGVDSAAFALTGQDAAFARTYALTADNAAFALTGQDVTLTYESGQSFTLFADEAAFALSAQNVALLGPLRANNQLTNADKVYARRLPRGVGYRAA